MSFPERVLLLGLARGGTTYLRQLLRSCMQLNDGNTLIEPYGDIDRRCWGTREISRKQAKEEYIQLSARIQSIPNNEKFLIKDHIGHYADWSKFFNQPFPFRTIYKNFYVIKLIRYDLFGLSTSLSLSQTTKKYTYFDADAQPRGVVIPIDIFELAVLTQWKYLLMLHDWPDCDIVINYDDLTGDHQLDLKQLFNVTGHIDIDPRQINIQRSIPYTESISNFDEIQKKFLEIVTNLKSDILNINENRKVTKK